MLIVLFLACPPAEGDKDSGDTGPVEIPLAPAFAAVAGATYADAFKSTCSMQLDLVDAASGNALATTGVQGHHHLGRLREHARWKRHVHLVHLLG